jgi:dihydroorotate dehydrogenase
MQFYSLIRPLFFALDAERAHDIALASLKFLHRLGVLKLLSKPVYLPNNVMGIDFPNSVGLAAGLDKNAEYIDALAALGFGFIEVGTVTPRPQAGNAKPRMFRLSKVGGIINRFGFNNVGLEQFIRNIQASQYQGILGINIGKNFDTPNERAIDDYLTCFHRVYEYADYITINISSPNTANLRMLQERKALGELLKAIKQAQKQLSQKTGRYVPVALKIAPDIDTRQLRQMADVMLKHKVDAIIATNTTISRYEVEGERHAEQAGGLSGAPLRVRSTFVVDVLSDYLHGAIPIIAVGGIFSAEDACEKIDAGASLVQIYSGLIYRGPSLVPEVARAFTP